MKEFAFLYRAPIRPDFQPSPQQMQDNMKQWQDWLGGIAAQGKLSSIGNQLGRDTKTVEPNNVVTNGPYAETKEMIGGYTIVKADTIEEAVELAKGCPILHVGGKVDIQDVIPTEMASK